MQSEQSLFKNFEVSFCLGKKETIALQHNIRFDFLIFFALLSNIFIQLQSQSQIKKRKVFSRWFFLAVRRAVKKVFKQDLITTSMRNRTDMLLILQIEKYIVMKRELLKCPTTDCVTTSKYKYNIIKHLKSCRKVNKNKKGANENKICSFCSKVFTKKYNRDRHVKNFRAHENCDNEDESSENKLYVPTSEIPCTQYKIEAKHDSHNEKVAAMLQNAVSTRDESQHLLSQNEVLVEEPVQFEYL